MYTVCPKCALPLAVTAADLRAGQGYVRCGRCANVFNALLRLSEESALAAEATTGSAPLPDIDMEDMDKASATMSRPALAEPEPEEPIHPPEAAPLVDPQGAAETASAEELEDDEFEDDMEFFDPDTTNPKIGIAPLHVGSPAARSSALWLVDTPSPPPPPPEESEPTLSEAANEAEEEFVEEEISPQRGTSTFETIVLEGDTFLQTEETIPEEVLQSEIANVSRRIAEANDTAEFTALMEGHLRELGEPDTRPAPELAALREATGDLFKRDANMKSAAVDPHARFAPIQSRINWRLMAGAALLALIFVLQAVNHWRDDLATRAGWLGPMRGLSSMFGERLEPNWDLNAYDLRQLGAAADSTDDQTLKVRLSLTNVGHRAQALPLIRLTLRDRFGKSVSRGELKPEEYLPADEHGQSMIRPDQRIDTEVRVLDPTRQASSFELDVCVSAAAGALRCASDAPALAARSS